MSSLDKKGLASLKFGDIIENGYASEDNPTRIGVFIRFQTVPRGQINAGKKIECRSDNGTFWTTDFGNDRLRKIGSILADRAAQAERMARLEEALKETMSRTVPYHARRRNPDVRWMVTWLHQRATWMNDPHAKAVLNSAAFDLGHPNPEVNARRALSQEGSEPS